MYSMLKKFFCLLLIIIVFSGCTHQVPTGTGLTTSPTRGDSFIPAIKDTPQYKEIVNASGYVNTDNITIGELVGKKVILLDFLTYSCINCIRTFPYLNDWYSKYKDDGLEIIGIHTPEFAFEKKYENVVKAMKKYNIKFPVVLDNDYATWQAYGNRFWPRKYIIDVNGNIVYDHIGEGKYEETEAKIQELLKELKTKMGMAPTIAEDMNDSLAVKMRDERIVVGSPEVYFGSDRNELFTNGTPHRAGEQLLSIPTKIEKNKLYLVGKWNITPEHAESTEANTKIIFRYEAKQVNIVASGESPVRLRILLDGKPVGTRAGSAVKNGVALIKEEELYELVKDTVVGEHTLEVIIENPGLQAFTFTFG